MTVLRGSSWRLELFVAPTHTPGEDGPANFVHSSSSSSSSSSFLSGKKRKKKEIVILEKKNGPTDHLTREFFHLGHYQREIEEEEEAAAAATAVDMDAEKSGGSTTLCAALHWHLSSLYSSSSSSSLSTGRKKSTKEKKLLCSTLDFWSNGGVRSRSALLVSPVFIVPRPLEQQQQKKGAFASCRAHIYTLYILSLAP